VKPRAAFEYEEHRERNDLLQDFQLRQRQCGVSDAIGRQLQHDSNSAIPHETRAAIHHGAVLRCFR
jgi:hypothetical protein